MSVKPPKRSRADGEGMSGAQKGAVLCMALGA